MLHANTFTLLVIMMYQKGANGSEKAC